MAARRTPGLLAAVFVAACQATAPSVPPNSSPPGVTPTGSAMPSTVASATAAPTPPPEHRIGIRVVDGRGEFFDRETGERFFPRGANYVHFERNVQAQIVDRLFAEYDGDAVTADFTDMRDLGYTAVRIALDICQGDCIGNQDGSLNAEYLANVADLLRRAGAADLPVVIQSNDLPAVGGWVPRVEATCCSPFDGYLNSQYLSPIGMGVYREYWTAILDGLRTAGAPFDAVLGWNVRGELFLSADTAPLNLRSGQVTTANGRTYDLSDAAARTRMVDEGIVHWVDEMAGLIRSYDPNALVGVGEFAPNSPNVWRGDDPRAPPTIDTFLRTSVDFVDVHPYPGYVPLADLLENMGVTGDEPKPVIFGEYGAFTFAFADPAAGAGGLMAWQSESCGAGIDGWFHWHWKGVGDHEVWTGSEADSAINTVLSPRERPDPCATRDFPFLQQNLALGAATRASASIAGQAPERAVDGIRESGWVSGDGPKQWLEIDLGQPATIETVRLVVDQSPGGRTVHRLLAGADAGSLREVHVFDGQTDYGDVLEWMPEDPLTGVRVIRIETTVSPSWIAWQEVELLGRR